MHSLCQPIAVRKSRTAVCRIRGLEWVDAPSDCVHFASQYPTSPSMCSPWATLADLPRSKDTPSNGEPWHLPCPRHAARKSTDSPPGPVRACTGPSTCGPTAWGRRWVVHGWPFAGVHWEPCTWSCEGGRGRSSFSCVVCSVCFRCRRRCRRRRRHARPHTRSQKLL